MAFAAAYGRALSRSSIVTCAQPAGGGSSSLRPLLGLSCRDRGVGRRCFVITSIESFRRAGRVLALMAIAAGSGSVSAAPSDPPAFVAPAPSAAERIYAAAPARLLQFRTLVAGAERQSSTGSGFPVTADGLAITNYHVVSQVPLAPKTYRLQNSRAASNTREPQSTAIDLAHD